ncbi:MAG: NYN domain-containing protein [Patescibacteria group bacterium]|nr:NYN domain-containing protein [Patescibacteria group bacterium]
MAKNRVFIVVDGSNLYYRLKELKIKNQLNFDFGAFTKYLSGGNNLAGKSYYVGAVREDPRSRKSHQLMIDQHRLIGRLIKAGFRVELGYLLKSGGKYHEKGVDVKMAMDILVGAYEEKYDIVYLISSDTDLLPVIDKVRSMKKKVVYVGFSHKPSYALIKHSSERILLRLEDVKKFVKKKPR